MIALVEGAERQKTPNEIALNILLAGMTSSSCSSIVTLKSPTRRFAMLLRATAFPITVLVALLRDADPDHHRRAAVRHRHRRHGPPGPPTCSRCRAARWRRRATSIRAPAARQDRHDHLRQPAGERVRSPLPGVSERGARGGGAARLASPTRRPRAAVSSCWRQGEVRHPRPRRCRGRRILRPVHGRRRA